MTQFPDVQCVRGGRIARGLFYYLLKENLTKKDFIFNIFLQSFLNSNELIESLIATNDYSRLRVKKNFHVT